VGRIERPWLVLSLKHVTEKIALGARQELNGVHVLGSLGVAGFLGALTGSWAVFLVVGAAMIAGSFYTGGIRPKGRQP